MEQGQHSHIATPVSGVPTIIAGSFATDVSGDLSGDLPQGVTAIARSTGEYTLTLDAPYNALLFGVFGEADGTPEMFKAFAQGTSNSTVSVDFGTARTSSTVYFQLHLQAYDVA